MRRLIHRSGRLAWEINGKECESFAEVAPEIASKICSEFNSLDAKEAMKGRDFFITVPDPERMKGEAHQEGSHELAEARVHTVGQIALPRGRKQIHVREVLS